MENSINEFDVVKRVLFGDLPESDPQFRQWLESSNANLLLFLELKGEVECAVSEGFDKKRSFEDISEILGLNKKWNLFRKNKLWMVPLFVAATLTLFWGLFRTFVSADKDTVAQTTVTSLPDAVNTAYLVSPGCDSPIYLQDRFTVKLRDGSMVMNEESCLSFTDTGNLSGVPEHQTLFVPRGTDYSLTLSDGTRVKLNSDSEISFPSRFSGQERRVRIQGEAYFEVTKSETPFIVETDEMEVEVLGTIFNINSYSASPCCMATLVEGSVKVRSESIEGGLVLRPSENLVLRASEHSYSVSQVDTDIYTAWTRGQFIFRGQRLEDIFSTLSRWYDFDIVFRRDDIKDMRFTGSADRSRDIEFLLDLISSVTDIRYAMNDGKLILY